MRCAGVCYRRGFVTERQLERLQARQSRRGVPRLHSLGITFARALGIPARAVSAYALQLDSADFHAIFEVYIENDWWLIDPTRLAPDQQCQVIRQTVKVSRA